MLFVSFFWASFHSSCSPSLGNYYEGFYVPDPCELTYANTLLLSNAAISLGCGFIMKEIYSSTIILLSLISFILAWTFISLQIKDYCLRMELSHVGLDTCHLYRCSLLFCILINRDIWGHLMIITSNPVRRITNVNFISLVKNCNHKRLGIYYLLSALIFGLSGTLLSSALHSTN